MRTHVHATMAGNQAHVHMRTQHWRKKEDSWKVLAVLLLLMLQMLLQLVRRLRRLLRPRPPRRRRLPVSVCL